jgi:hypothetical protein
MGRDSKTATVKEFEFTDTMDSDIEISNPMHPGGERSGDQSPRSSALEAQFAELKLTPMQSKLKKEKGRVVELDR